MTQSMLFTLVLASVVLLAVLAVAALLLRDPKAAIRHVEALFRKPRKPARTPSEGHYYKPYWS